MKNEILSKFPHVWMTCAALVLFLGVFVGSLAWIFRAGSASHYSRLGRAPLTDGDET